LEQDYNGSKADAKEKAKAISTRNNKKKK